MARSIFIGDVHGCADELSELLERIGPVSGDRVVFVGDLVARGPDTRRVLRIAREMGALSVLGNHEERLVAARAARRKGEPTPKLGPTHAWLVHHLDEEEWHQIEGFPLKLDFEDIGVRVVHAGLVPGIAWAEQDPWMVTHIRSIDETGAPSARWGRPWGASYGGPEHVVFGHNAQSSLQLHPFATGLDTACVYGGRLTALVLEGGVPIPKPEERESSTVSVAARQKYMDYGHALPDSRS
jgi:hypothetical protein